MGGPKGQCEFNFSFCTLCVLWFMVTKVEVWTNEKYSLENILEWPEYKMQINTLITTPLYH